MTNSTPDTLDIAKWMLSELEKHHLLHQGVVVYGIKRRFGKQFVYCNVNGNLAISANVLAAFRNLSGDNVVWIRTGRYWRRRRKQDKLGRQQG